MSHINCEYAHTWHGYNYCTGGVEQLMGFIFRRQILTISVLWFVTNWLWICPYLKWVQLLYCGGWTTSGFYLWKTNLTISVLCTICHKLIVNMPILNMNTTTLLGGLNNFWVLFLHYLPIVILGHLPIILIKLCLVK